MKSFQVFLYALIQLISLVSAGLLTQAIPPSADPFYTPPSDLASSSPGDILRSRLIPTALRSVVLPLKVKNTWQLLVRSTDIHGNPSAIVTTVIQPFNADPSKLVSYQIAEDAAGTDCAVSYAIEVGAPPISTIATQAEMIVVSAILNEGWYVVTPDYEGFNGEFTVGQQAGQATLDSVRAALKFADSGLDSDAQTVLWGYSGGSIAAGWAAALQPKYAPELKSNLIGAAVGGFVGNVTLTAEVCDGTIYSGLIALAFHGLTNAYPQLGPYVQLQLYDWAKPKYNSVANTCLIPTVIGFVGTLFFSGPTKLLKTGWWDFINSPLVAPVIANNTLALTNDGNLPQIPIFVFQSRLDEVVPFVGVQRIVDNWCNWGIGSLEFATDVLNGHVSEFVSGSPAALAWVKNLFNGATPVQGCVTEHRISNIEYPGASLSLAYTLASAIKGLIVGLGPLNPFPIPDFGLPLL